MKFFGIICTTAVICLTGSTLTLAAPEKFNLDKDLTYVGFSVSYLAIVPVNGRFDDFEGAFIIDSEHPENNRADIIIKTTSIDAGSESRNRDIRGPALFNVEEYPEMIFHSSAIELFPDNTGLIKGNLTLRGVTKPVTLDLIRVPDIETQEAKKTIDLPMALPSQER
jgi:polyisoprenoid-binding protein YceI